MVTNKLYNKMTYKEDMCFHKEDMCVLLSVNIRYQSTLCIIIHEELGAIECLNSWHVLTLSPFQFHKNEYFEIHVFLICHFVL